MLSSSNSNPVRPIRSAVNLTCIVRMELGPAVDVPVILTTVLTVPDGSMTTINVSQPIWGMNSTTYTSRAILSSFGREQSETYTCVAILSSLSTNPYLTNGSSTSNSIQVTSGKIYVTWAKFADLSLDITCRCLSSPEKPIHC